MHYIVLTPWKIQNKSVFLKAFDFFEKRIEQNISFEIRTPKSDFEKPTEQNEYLVKEMKKLKELGYCIFCCDENGISQTSASFAKLIQTKEAKFSKGIAFCVGGAYGLPQAAAEYIEKPLISLSSMTFSHELALTLLLEQIYRQFMIRRSHPYHHGEPSDLSKTLLLKNNKNI